MSIRQKTITALAVTAVALVGVLYGVLGIVLRAGFGAVERRDATLNVQRVQEGWTAPLQNLAEKLGDWAQWDDAYRFVIDRNQAFIDANQELAPFRGMKVDLMMFIGTDGVPVHVMAYDRAADAEAPPPRAVIDAHFAPGSPNLAFAGLTTVNKGVVLTPGYPPMLFAATPITNSRSQGPAHGTLLFGAWFDRGRQEALAQLTKMQLTFHEAGDPALPADVAAASPRLQEAGSIFLRAVNEDVLACYTRIDDAYGRQGIIVRADTPRVIHQQAKATLRWLLLSLAVVALVFTIVVLALLERLVLRRVTRLAAVVSGVTESFDFSARVSAGGRDEIARLGVALNGLLAAVEQVVYVGMQAEHEAAPPGSQEAPGASAPAETPETVGRGV
jgi:sensor domain CHASE-containing protein